MNAPAADFSSIQSIKQKHPRGLYVLFSTEMWERFSFYSMLSMFTLYLQDPIQGFGWSSAQATELYSTYLMFVYASPLVGGWLADKKLGYHRAVLIGGIFFMIGHLLLAFHSLSFVYAALTCLVIGNGFFKPNVSAMVGNLYPENSPLKDSAFIIFYMGINIGALLSSIIAEIVHNRYGYHPAFAVAAGGMVISVFILMYFRKQTEPFSTTHLRIASSPAQDQNPPLKPETVAVSIDKPPRSSQEETLETVPEKKRLFALGIVFLVVIVFWMCFHQNGSTFTYFADKNTRWNVSGVISNAINPFWIIVLTYPLIGFWKRLRAKNLEPSTPTKMAIGMVLTAFAFYFLGIAGKMGGDVGRVSPAWIIIAYLILTLGELLVSPMGLSLVSKVAPIRMRGLMMGMWFVVTAIGSKLTIIGIYWDVWKHSNYFALLGSIALLTSLILFLLIRPLKRAMPGV